MPDSKPELRIGLIGSGFMGKAPVFGFAHSISDWRTLVDHPDIDVIDITAPNALHRAMTADAPEMAEAPGRQGFRCIEASPAHPPYGNFCVAPGHQPGFNDLNAIRPGDVMRTIRWC